MIFADMGRIDSSNRNAMDGAEVEVTIRTQICTAGFIRRRELEGTLGHLGSRLILEIKREGREGDGSRRRKRGIG